jgi:hypothetical protein
MHVRGRALATLLCSRRVLGDEPVPVLRPDGLEQERYFFGLAVSDWEKDSEFLLQPSLAALDS